MTSKQIWSNLIFYFFGYMLLSYLIYTYTSIIFLFCFFIGAVIHALVSISTLLFNIRTAIAAINDPEGNE
jgi:hypothetical protein